MRDIFALSRPCVACPFRRVSEVMHLGRKAVDMRAEFTDRRTMGRSFMCHQTIDYSEDSSGDTTDAAICAGFVGTMRKMGRDPDIVQLAERLSGYDPDQYATDEVFDSLDEFVASHTRMGD